MSATRDEVLRKMAEAVIDKATDGEGFADSWEIPGDHPTMVIMANEMAQAALAAAEQAGWVLAPVEATEEMVEKGRSYFSYHPLLVSSWARKTWAAMLNAAPKVTP